MSDLIVTLFSNTAQEKFPANSTSKFTVHLPRPLDLRGNWYVGLLDCHHPPIITVVEGSEEQDLITFPHLVSEKTFTYNLELLVNTLLKYAKRPEMYDKRYFHEFLVIENFGEFSVNETLSKYKTTLTPNKHQFKITPYMIDPQFRQSLVDRDYIKFESDRPYTMRQILYNIINTYHTILVQGKNQYGIEIEAGRTIGEMLYLYSFTFINTVRKQVGFSNDHVSNYLLIYTDMVIESIVGNEVARLLYATPRKSDVQQDYAEVRHVRYIKVAKSFISDISFLFCNERGHQYLFESGYLPTWLTLHFVNKA